MEKKKKKKKTLPSEEDGLFLTKFILFFPLQ